MCRFQGNMRLNLFRESGSTNKLVSTDSCVLGAKTGQKNRKVLGTASNAEQLGHLLARFRGRGERLWIRRGSR